MLNSKQLRNLKKFFSYEVAKNIIVEKIVSGCEESLDYDYEYRLDNEDGFPVVRQFTCGHGKGCFWTEQLPMYL